MSVHDLRSNPSSYQKSLTPHQEEAFGNGNILQNVPFVWRHIGPRPHEIEGMARECGYQSLDDLVNDTVPAKIRIQTPLQLPNPGHERSVLLELRELSLQNRLCRSYIGLGYYGCITPAVIQRNLFENPGWYTQYTPYQAEIAQGRLESLLNFQTMVRDLTALDIANASLLDEATAAAEAMTLAFSSKGKDAKSTFFVAEDVFPQTQAVLKTRAQGLGIQVLVGPIESMTPDDTWFGALVQNPGQFGQFRDISVEADKIHAKQGLFIVAADLLSLTLFRPPGEMGADIAVGNTQRFGVPLGFGGPHAAYFATKDALKRRMPGRLVGVSRDSAGKPAYRLTLQTREQHIRREKATSNVCTAQALLANMAAMYAVFHGPEGLRSIALDVHQKTLRLSRWLESASFTNQNTTFFDTLHLRPDPELIAAIRERAEKIGINFYYPDKDGVAISLDETVTEKDLADVYYALTGEDSPSELSGSEGLQNSVLEGLNPAFQRKSDYLRHPVFNSHHSETRMMRYLCKLESRDLSLTTSMIPLGSCTMKLNAVSEMLPVSWPELGGMHPFAPMDQAQGYLAIFKQLESWLSNITGLSAVSLQPNAGSQGEFAGLMVIRQYQESMGQGHRKKCLIPESAHGTNPASAVMAGMEVIAVSCDEQGNIDVSDLKFKAESHTHDLAALMVTYPSTHGVFEESIIEISSIIHECGGQVYMDGANLNAQVGLCRPGDLGADVCHLNLHKTFCIPHGGGGPGMGPIAVGAHLADFLPTHPLVELHDQKGMGPVSAAPWGSPSILSISWVYLRLMGVEGLTMATKVAILNANYIATRLADYFPVLYRGRTGRVAHECILDLRRFKTVTVEDVAKRLMDYGFHAPTISWPVAGTMMVEPTESEDLEELNRFCEAMISIHGEIMEIENRSMDPRDNPLKNAPHPAAHVMTDEWNHPYSRQKAAFPLPWVEEHKFWPVVGRIDNVHGDRNPICACVGMEAYASAPLQPK